MKFPSCGGKERYCICLPSRCEGEVCASKEMKVVFSWESIDKERFLHL